MDGLSSWFTYVGDNWDNILEATWQHARLALIVVVSATVFAVAVGIFVQQRPTARNAVLSIAGIFLTIPSLALFALFIPIVGIGNPPAIMALFLYSLLPILRNTVTGLDEVNPAVVESARGMGMNKGQQLLKVKLPLAWPVIMAGVRVSNTWPILHPFPSRAAQLDDMGWSIRVLASYEPRLSNWVLRAAASWKRLYCGQ